MLRPKNQHTWYKHFRIAPVGRYSSLTLALVTETKKAEINIFSHSLTGWKHPYVMQKKKKIALYMQQMQCIILIKWCMMHIWNSSKNIQLSAWKRIKDGFICWKKKSMILLHIITGGKSINKN